ncbi:MAG: metallophosphoesterase [Actinomycetales bacterium]|nr:MAG: metallophosphoesterase [Actinomycetales bacterium]
MLSTVAVLSDVHGVLPALEAVLAEPGVADADLVVVTGDHTWGPQPAEVLDRLRGLGAAVLLVRGNADRELLQMSRGIDVGLADDPLSVWGAGQMTTAHQELLDAMPEQVTLEIEGFGPVRFCHATPRDDQEVVLVDSRLERWAEVLADLPDDVRTVVCGHTHMPFLRLVDRRLVVNPGSVGLPYGHDGASWAVLSGGQVTFGRTALDHDQLVRDVVAGSSWTGVAAWAEETLRRPAGDVEALTTFGPRDGRRGPH